jgi:NADPH2:quinone reductase
MRAVWYERQGPAAEALVVGETATPHTGPGEVRVELAVSTRRTATDGGQRALRSSTRA